MRRKEGELEPKEKLGKEMSKARCRWLGVQGTEGREIRWQDEVVEQEAGTCVRGRCYC